MEATTILFFLAGLILIFVLGKFLIIPLKWIIRLLMNGIMGGVFLFLFNIVGGFFNLSIEISPLNAILVGVFGVPGLVFLLVINFLL